MMIADFAVMSYSPDESARSGSSMPALTYPRKHSLKMLTRLSERMLSVADVSIGVRLPYARTATSAPKKATSRPSSKTASSFRPYELSSPR